MRLSTILPVLAVACSLQVLAIPTQKSGRQSDTKSSLMEPQVESSFHQNKEQNQISESRTQDHTSSEDNSPKDSADRIRKIVEAALASRRATTPGPRYRITSNHKETGGQEIRETSDRKSEVISHSNESMMQNQDSLQSIHPVNSSKDMIRNNNTSSDIRKPHIVYDGNDNDKSNKAYNRGSASALSISNKQLPTTNTKIKPHQSIPIMSSSHTFSKLSDSKELVTESYSKSMPSLRTKSKIISIRNRNNDFKTKTSDLSSTPESKSLPILPITPSTEGSYTYDREKYSNLKFISPWEKRTEVGRKTQLDAIRKLIGRHILPFNSKDSQESYETLSTTHFGSIIKSSSSSLVNENSDEDMSSSENNLLHRNNTTSLPNTSNTMLPNLESFRKVEPKKYNIQLEESTYKPKSITVNNENVKFPSTSGVRMTTKINIDIKEPVRVTENSKSLDQIQPKLTMQPNLESFRKVEPKKYTIQLEESSNKPKLITMNNENDKLPSTSRGNMPEKMNVDIKGPVHVTENSKSLDQIQPKLINTIDYSTNVHQTPSDQDNRNHEQSTHSTEITTDISINNFTDYSDVNESLVEADVTEHLKTLNQTQLALSNNYNHSKNAYKIPFEQNERNREQDINSSEKLTKKSIINMALDDYSDVIGSLFEYGELGTLDYNFSEPDKPSEPRDLSSMIIDLLFKVTGFSVR